MTGLVAAELFSGGGGLAVGLKRAGVQPSAAVELDQYASDTFALNHPDVTLFRNDVRVITGEALRATSRTGRIDILAACPPCQGFSTLTAKYRKPDDRNALVAEVGRIAGELRPAAIMLENVPGLAGRGKPLLDELITTLEADGYVVNWSVLQVANYGVPQMRRRLVLLAGRGFFIPMPAATHSQVGARGLPYWRTIRDTLTLSTSALRLDEAQERGGFAAVNWHVVRKLGKANLDRLRATAPGKGRSQLPEELRPECHRGRDDGFTNTYGRLDWDQPSSTITAGCLSPSKGRFGHPEDLRTISLREAAMIQTFPIGYRFAGDTIDRACSVVGNALPCMFAEAIASRVARSVLAATPWLEAEDDLANGCANRGRP